MTETDTAEQLRNLSKAMAPAAESLRAIGPQLNRLMVAFSECAAVAFGNQAKP